MIDLGKVSRVVLDVSRRLLLPMLFGVLSGAAMAQAPSGALRIGFESFFGESFDPIISSSGNKSFLSPMWNTVIGNEPDGRLSKETGIARDWEVTHAANSSTYVIKLRKGVKFHNGDEVTSADVKYSIERVMSPASVETMKRAFVASVASIETPDPLTVVIKTKAPYGFLLYDLSNSRGLAGYVYPRKYVESVGAAKFNREPIGTGPYRFVRHEPGNRIVYEAFPDYWGKKPKFKTLEFILLPEETTRIAALKSNSVDVSIVSRASLDQLSGYKLVRKPGEVLFWAEMLTVFGEGSVFKDARVRRALNLAINREEIRDFIYKGQAQITQWTASGTKALGYKPLDPYPYDPATAQKLIREVFPRGLEIELYSYSRSGNSEMPRVMEAISGYYQAIGIKTKITPMDWGEIRKRMAERKISNVIVPIGGPNTPFQHNVFHTMYASKGVLGVLEPAPAELEKMLQDIYRETDQDRFGAKQYALAKYIQEHYLTIPLMEVGQIFAVNSGKVTEWVPYNIADDMNWEGIR
jgi:peptide/nickel transport system substrate-binding protein